MKKQTTTSLKRTNTAAPLNALLTERGSRYGVFISQGDLSQRIKAEFKRFHQLEWNQLRPDQREGLEMIAHKIARIINGDPNYNDSWQDIIGYAQLVIDRNKLEEPA